MAKKYGIEVETIMMIKSLIKKIKYLFYHQWATRLKVSSLTSKQNEIKLEIGAGTFIGKNGWTTLDINTTCDLYWDLRDGIPFPDNSVSKIYSSHLFEHIPYNGIVKLLSECKRVLKKDGVFSICVPNARPYIMGYANKDNSFWNSIPTFYTPALTHNTPIDMINYVAYMNEEHKYLFDEENLLAVLRDNGFKDVKTRGFDPELDLKERDLESIYAIGIVDK